MKLSRPLKTVLTIGVPILAAALLPFVLSPIFERQKQLSYDVVTGTTIESYGSEKKEIGKALHFQMEGRTFTNLEFTTIRIANTGSLPIARSDYDENVTIRFAKTVEILSADTTRSSPQSLPVQVVTRKDSVSIEPLLLNSGDWFEVSILLTHAAPLAPWPSDKPRDIARPVSSMDATVNARIVGMQDIVRSPQRETVSPKGKWRLSFELYGTIFLYFYTIAFFVKALDKHDVQLTKMHTFVILALLVSAIPTAAIPLLSRDFGISLWIVIGIYTAVGLFGFIVGWGNAGVHKRPAG